MTSLISKPEFDQIARIAYERWGLNLTERKTHLVGNRLTSFLRKQDRWHTAADYLNHIEDGATDEERLVFFDILSTNVTSFFRDKGHFDFLEREFYTALDRGNITLPGKRIRLWSAACSNGSEPYSMVIHAMETMESFRNWDFKVLATDLSNSAIAAAKAARYEAKVVDPLPAKMRGRYFQQVTGPGGATEYEVQPEVRSRVTIRRRNLMEPMRFKYQFDVIMCRNVMIYFDQPTRQSVVERLAAALRPGGYFIVGSAESLTGLNVPLTTVQPAIYRRA